MEKIGEIPLNVISGGKTSMGRSLLPNTFMVVLFKVG
jgi:hypothetical protein